MKKRVVGSRDFEDKKRYLFSLFLGGMLIFIVFFVSYGINAFEFERISGLQDDVFYDFYEAKAYHDLFAENNCNDEYMKELNEALDFQGVMLGNLEKEFGKNNEYVKKRKDFYYLLQFSHYEYMKELSEECDFNRNFILFFYSNSKEYLDKSEEIGNVLSYVKEKYPNVLIYSFDTSSGNELIKKFSLAYNIDSPIAIVINDNNKLDEVKNVKQIESFLN